MPSSSSCLISEEEEERNQWNRLEALERTLEEIEALKIIYNEEYNDDDFGGGDNINSSTSFTVLSVNELQKAQDLVQKYQNEDEVAATATATATAAIPTLRVQLVLPLVDDDSQSSSTWQAKLHFNLSPGYLNSDDSINVPAIISVLSLGNFNRSQREEVTTMLNDKAIHIADSSSSEAIMLLIQELQDVVRMTREKNVIDNVVATAAVDQGIRRSSETEVDHGFPSTSSTSCRHQNGSSSSITKTILFSRRWIWVHHITNLNRIHDIVNEATDLSLSGYLKSGYPGVCVIEGRTNSCDEFVQWIKGNKSRPGGFGRNWGHHVRGQIEFEVAITGTTSTDTGTSTSTTSSTVLVEEESPKRRGFDENFIHVGEDLAELAEMCRHVGKWMEDEFLSYVMQH